MPSFLYRYLHGEREQVWHDLAELGVDVRTTSIYPDALAVARETMERARQNIEIIIPRLRDAGYTFGYYALGLEHVLPGFAKTYQTFAPPPMDIGARLEALEQRAGTLPLSLSVWYQTVGEINLIGRPPASWHADPYQLDPLQFDPLESVIETHDDWIQDQAYSLSLANEDRNEDEIEYFAQTHLDIMPDTDIKFGYSGRGSYDIIVPNVAADALLIGEPHQLTFVGYLRRACRCGGFLGLEFGAALPVEVIHELTRDLLPL